MIYIYLGDLKHFHLTYIHISKPNNFHYSWLTNSWSGFFFFNIYFGQTNFERKKYEKKSVIPGCSSLNDLLTMVKALRVNHLHLLYRWVNAAIVWILRSCIVCTHSADSIIRLSQAGRQAAAYSQHGKWYPFFTIVLSSRGMILQSHPHHHPQTTRTMWVGTTGPHLINRNKNNKTAIYRLRDTICWPKI